MARTAFVVDSTTLIAYLARSSVGYEPAKLLLERLLDLGAKVVTTDLLIEEVAEHARWAQANVDTGGQETRIRAMEAMTGRAGQRSNAFLEGFVIEAARGSANTFLTDYLRSLFGLSLRRNVLSGDVESSLARARLLCRPLASWDGFTETMLVEREEVQEKIGARRQERLTYRHERQVKAEAEALLIGRYIRRGDLDVDAHGCKAAFFISHTRVIDEVEGARLPITIRPEGVLHLVATLKPLSADELNALTDGLLWELSERNLSVIDPRLLTRVFTPLIDASREDREEQLEHHRALIAQAYGEDAVNAFADVADIDLPIAMESFHAQRAQALEEALTANERRVAVLQQQKALSAHERAELERLRQTEKHRGAAGRSAKRAARSSSSSRRKRKKRRGK